MRRSRKNRDSRPNYHLNYRKFQDAKWILKKNKTGEIIECDYRKMSGLVSNGYVVHTLI